MEHRKWYQEVVSGTQYQYVRAPISAVLHVKDGRMVWHLFTHASWYIGHFRTRQELRRHIGAIR